MNSIHRVIWSAAKRRWVVTSELTRQRGKSRSSRDASRSAEWLLSSGSSLRQRMLAAGLSLLALCSVDAAAQSTCAGGGAPVGGQCALPSYSPQTNDGVVNPGVTTVASGQTVTLTGAATQIQAGSTGFAGTVALSQLFADGRVVGGAQYADPANPASLVVNTGAKSQILTIPDPITGGNRTTTVYVNSNIVDTHATSVALAYGFNTSAAVNNNQYVATRLGTVSATGGTLNVNLGVGGAADAVDNAVFMNAKQTSLFYADGTGGSASAVVWQSQNQIHLGGTLIAVPGGAPTSVVNLGFSVYRGTFTAFDGSSHTVNNAADLQAYNSFLVSQLQAGTMSPALYDTEFNRAYTTTLQPITYTNGPADTNDEVYQAVGTRAVIQAVGANASGVVASGARLDGTSISKDARYSNSFLGAVMLGDQGATITNNGSLSSLRTGNDKQYAMYVQGGAHAINNGVANIGFLAGKAANTDPVAPSTSGTLNEGMYATGVGSTLVNNGILNVLAPSSTGMILRSRAQGTNTGIINLDTGGASTTNTASTPAVLAYESTSFTNAAGATIYLGRGFQYTAGTPAADIANGVTIMRGIYVANTSATPGTVINAGTITLGSLSESSQAIYVINSNAAVSNAASGVINVNGNASASPIENIGIYVANSTNVINAGTINLNGVNGIGIKAIDTTVTLAEVLTDFTEPVDQELPVAPGAPATVTSSGVINVAGGISPSGLRNYGIWSQGPGSVVTLSGQVNLSGSGAIGVHARTAGKINITSVGSVNFTGGSNQIGYFIYGPGSIITNNATGSQDVSTQDSTLFRIEAGADFAGGTGGATFAASGTNATAFTITGLDSASSTRSQFDSGNMTLNLTGQNARGVFINGGATGTVATGAAINLTGAGSIAGVVDGLRYDVNNGVVEGPVAGTLLTNRAIISSGTPDIIGFVAQNQGQLVNAGSISFGGAGSTGIIVRANGILNNDASGSVQVGNGTGVRVEGAGAQISNTGLIRADDGVAALHLVSGAGANLTGGGGIVFGGSADGVLVDSGSSGLTTNGASITALETLGSGVPGTGAGIDNVGEISGISLVNTLIEVGNGQGIRTATSFDPASSVQIRVQNAGVGLAFQTDGGGVASAALNLGSGYRFQVNGAGGVGIRALTSGAVDTSAEVTVNSANGGAALIAGTPSGTTQRGTLTSVSTVAPVVDLSNGSGTHFTNLGTISAVDVAHNAIQGSAGADMVDMAGGAITGIVGTGDGSDTVNWTNGTLNGAIEMGAANDALALSGVNLTSTYHVDGGSGNDALTLAGIDYRGGTFTADNLSKGVNLGSNWETINLTAGTQFTLSDNLTLGGSTVNIDNSSTLFAGNGVHPVINATGGLPITLNNAGTIDLTNGGSGPTDTLTGVGLYLANGGTLKLDTVLNEGGVNSQSDELIVNSTSLGSGPTTITVVPAGGAGAETVDNGIEVVRVLNSGQSAAGVFQLSGRIVAGAYEYDLYQGSFSGPANGNWYLRTITQPEPPTPPEPPVPPSPPPEPPAPSPRPETGLYVTNLAAASTMFMHTLHDRLGEPQYTDAYQSEGRVPSAWVRVVGSQSKGEAAGGAIDTKADTTLVHFGGDIAQWRAQGSQRFHLGLMGAWGRSDTSADSNDVRFTNNGMRRQASGDVEGYSVGVYGTWYNNERLPSGPYLDSWLQYGWFNNSVRGNGLPEENYDSSGWLASIEGGWAFVLHDNGQRQWMIEPQGQIAYSWLNEDDHREANGTRVTGGRADGVITRLGARTYSRSSLGDNGIQPFVEVNWWYSNVKNSLSFNGTPIEDGTPDNTFELKAGLQGEIAKSWQVWGHVGGRWGADRYRRYEGMLGVKYQF